MKRNKNKKSVNYKLDVELLEKIELMAKHTTSRTAVVEDAIEYFYCMARYGKTMDSKDTEFMNAVLLKKYLGVE